MFTKPSRLDLHLRARHALRARPDRLGNEPATSRTWKTDMPQPARTQRQREADDPGIEREEPHRQEDHEREHEDALVPAQDAGRQLHHLAEEERAQRRQWSPPASRRRRAARRRPRCRVARSPDGSGAGALIRPHVEHRHHPRVLVLEDVAVDHALAGEVLAHPDRRRGARRHIHGVEPRLVGRRASRAARFADSRAGTACRGCGWGGPSSCRSRCPRRSTSPDGGDEVHAVHVEGAAVDQEPRPSCPCRTA